MDSKDDEEGECLLFPSKEVRDWNNFQLPASHSFKPFDKVVVYNGGLWHVDFFERFDSSEKLPYRCVGSNWKYCLPFNDETTILIGTSNSLNNEETNNVLIKNLTFELCLKSSFHLKPILPVINAGLRECEHLQKIVPLLLIIYFIL